MGWTERDIPDQSGRTVFVTGANSGLGLHVSRALAQHGARVLMGARDVEKGRAAVERVRQTAPLATVELVRVDLGDLASRGPRAGRPLRPRGGRRRRATAVGRERAAHRRHLRAAPRVVAVAAEPGSARTVAARVGHRGAGSTSSPAPVAQRQRQAP